MSLFATVREGRNLHRLNVDCIMRVTENQAEGTVLIQMKDRTKITVPADNAGGLLLRLDRIDEMTTRQAEAMSEELS